MMRGAFAFGVVDVGRLWLCNLVVEGQFEHGVGQIACSHRESRGVLVPEDESDTKCRWQDSVRLHVCPRTFDGAGCAQKDGDASQHCVPVEMQDDELSGRRQKM